MIIVNNQKAKEKRRLLRTNQTPQELKVWNFLRAYRGVLKWRRQVSIGPYIADFYCRRKRFVIEIDGSQHLEAKDYDFEREKYFSALGIKTIRFWNYEINSDFEKVTSRILDEIRESSDSEDPLKVVFK